MRPLWDAPGDSDPLVSMPELMNSMRYGGPARPRTWDQGIMSNRISFKSSEKTEKPKPFFGVLLDRRFRKNLSRTLCRNPGVFLPEKSVGDIGLGVRAIRAGAEHAEVGFRDV
jgi:hypothetical protein